MYSTAGNLRGDACKIRVRFEPHDASGFIPLGRARRGVESVWVEDLERPQLPFEVYGHTRMQDVIVDRERNPTPGPSPQAGSGSSAGGGAREVIRERKR